MIAYRPTIVLERLVNGMDALTVFLDSNEYKRCGHNFSSTPMRKIQELAEKETIYLLITNVVMGEVSEHIKENVQAFAEDQKQLAHKAGCIRNIPELIDIIRKIDVDAAHEKAQQAFQTFLEHTKCEILSSNDINNDALLADFFAHRFPFEDHIKKAAEFKDAFIVYALRKYVEENDVKIYVVSADTGLRESFFGDNRFLLFSKSDDLFAYITKIVEVIPAENAKLIQQFIDDPDTFEQLVNRIEDAIYSSGVWIEDAEDDADVEAIEVKCITLSYLDDLSDNVLPIHIGVKVRLTVDYTCIDEDNSYWDKEDGAYLFMATSHLRLMKQMQLDFNANLIVKADEEGKVTSIDDVEEFEIEDAQHGIRIVVEDDDEIEVLHSSMDDCREDDVPNAYSTCPDCGCKINIENDGGNGFCINCAPKH